MIDAVNRLVDVREALLKVQKAKLELKREVVMLKKVELLSCQNAEVHRLQNEYYHHSTRISFNYNGTCSITNCICRVSVDYH